MIVLRECFASVCFSFIKYCNGIFWSGLYWTDGLCCINAAFNNKYLRYIVPLDFLLVQYVDASVNFLNTALSSMKWMTEMFTFPISSTERIWAIVLLTNYSLVA